MTEPKVIIPRAGAILAAGAAAWLVAAVCLLKAVDVPHRSGGAKRGPALEPLAERLVILHLDSLRDDFARDPAKMPEFVSRSLEGATGRTRTPAVSSTGPAIKALFRRPRPLGPLGGRGVPGFGEPVI